MSLFRFTLDPLSTIQPWERRGIPTLRWFALTLGHFWIDLGDVELFRYRPGILDVWGRTDPYADYQVAAFAQDLLGSAASAMAPLPPRVESLAVDWPGLCERRRESEARARRDRSRAARDLEYRAWRWLGERSPWTSAVVRLAGAFVRLAGAFVRVADASVTLTSGVVRLAGAVVRLADASVTLTGAVVRLADAVVRLAEASATLTSAVVRLGGATVRLADASVTAEVEGYFAPHRPDISWEETVEALERLSGTAATRPTR